MLPLLTVDIPARPRQFRFREETDVLTVDLMKGPAAGRLLVAGGDDDDQGQAEYHKCGEAEYKRCGEDDFTRCGEADFTRCGEAEYKRCG